jgi:hypothetical protein
MAPTELASWAREWGINPALLVLAVYLAREFRRFHAEAIAELRAIRAALEDAAEVRERFYPPPPPPPSGAAPAPS